VIKNREIEIKFATALFASTQMQIELFDKIKSTALYNEKHVVNLKKIQKVNIAMLNRLYLEFKPEEDVPFNQVVKMIEKFLDNIKNNPIEDVVEEFT
jgi:hypothetical protein